MNIFALSDNPWRAAEYHCDKHVVKMIIEYAQLMSTAHRLLDGKRTAVELPTGKSRAVYLLPGESASVVTLPPKKEGGKVRHKVVIKNALCYAASHANHPCGVWTRFSRQNYEWLVSLWIGVLDEYEERYGKIHSANRLRSFLEAPPKNIADRQGVSDWPQAMPEEYKHEDVVEAYRRFYVGAKARFAKWTAPATVPSWFISKIGAQDGTLYARAPRLDRRPNVHPGPRADAAPRKRRKVDHGTPDGVRV